MLNWHPDKRPQKRPETPNPCSRLNRRPRCKSLSGITLALCVRSRSFAKPVRYNGGRRSHPHLAGAGTRRRHMKLLQMADPVRYARMTSEELRATFLLEGMFNPGKIEYAYVDLDRTVIGSAVPTTGALTLETQPELRAEYFLERRELGVLNVGGAGSVVVDGVTFELDKLDCLYVGRGSKAVT